MEKFNQNKYMNEWKKENMSTVRASYKKEFVNEFKTACGILGITQSSAIKDKMEEIIEMAKAIK